MPPLVTRQHMYSKVDRESLIDILETRMPGLLMTAMPPGVYEIDVINIGISRDGPCSLDDIHTKGSESLDR